MKIFSMPLPAIPPAIQLFNLILDLFPIHNLQLN